MNNTPDYKENLFFEKKMDCKNCPYTDEYCASGDCERDNNLTEQWKKGELPEGFYYIKVKEVIANYPLLADCVEGLSYTYFLDYEDYVTEVLAPVPSYEEWKEYQELDEDYKRNVQLAIRFSLEADILKDLLKECRPYIALYTENNKHIGFTPETANLLQRIKEVLK